MTSRRTTRPCKVKCAISIAINCYYWSLGLSWRFNLGVPCKVKTASRHHYHYYISAKVQDTTLHNYFDTTLHNYFRVEFSLRVRLRAPTRLRKQRCVLIKWNKCVRIIVKKRLFPGRDRVMWVRLYNFRYLRRHIRKYLHPETTPAGGRRVCHNLWCHITHARWR